jgi:hypothetical protein
MTTETVAGTTVEIPQDNAIAFAVTFRKAGDRKKVSSQKVETDADKKMMTVQKKLFESEAFEAIRSFDAKITQWIQKNTVQIFGRRGIYLIAKDAIEDVEKQLQGFAKERKLLVDQFLKMYPLMVEAAKLLLNSEFQGSDYKSVETMGGKFNMAWYYISLATPDTLPKDVRESEVEKFREVWAKTAQECRDGLRFAFIELIEHLDEQLKPKEDGKQKKFFQSNIDNLLEFVDSLNRRNLTNDVELARVALQVKDLVAGAKAEEIRKSVDVRKAMLGEIAKVKETCNTLMSVEKRRKFDLED